MTTLKNEAANIRAETLEWAEKIEAGEFEQEELEEFKQRLNQLHNKKLIDDIEHDKYQAWLKSAEEEASLSTSSKSTPSDPKSKKDPEPAKDQEAKVYAQKGKDFVVIVSGYTASLDNLKAIRDEYANHMQTADAKKKADSGDKSEPEKKRGKIREIDGKRYLILEFPDKKSKEEFLKGLKQRGLEVAKDKVHHFSSKDEVREFLKQNHYEKSLNGQSWFKSLSPPENKQSITGKAAKGKGADEPLTADVSTTPSPGSK